MQAPALSARRPLPAIAAPHRAPRVFRAASERGLVQPRFLAGRRSAAFALLVIVAGIANIWLQMPECGDSRSFSAADPSPGLPSRSPVLAPDSLRAPSLVRH